MIKSLLLGAALSCAASAAAVTPLAGYQPLVHSTAGELILTQNGMALPGIKAYHEDLSRASQTIKFTYSYNVSNYGSLQNVNDGDIIKVALEIPKETSNLFAGSEINSVYFVTPTDGRGKCPLDAATMFVTEDLKGDPLSVTEVSGLKQYTGLTEHKADLETPVTIEKDRSYYVGYEFKLAKGMASNSYYVIIGDGTSPYGGWLGVTKNGQTSWDNYGKQGMNFYVCCGITGENMPENRVTAESLLDVLSVVNGENNEMGLVFKNLGANTVESLQLKYWMNGTEKTVTARPESEVGINATGDVYFDIVPDSSMLDYDFKVTVTGVNGEPNNIESAIIEAKFPCMNPGEGKQRWLVIEEGTATWCQYCPLGYVAIEGAKERYAEDPFISIAIHSNDPMGCSSYTSFLNKYLTGFPSYIPNRCAPYTNGFVYNTQYNDMMIDALFTFFTSQPSLGEVNLTAEMVEDDAEKIEVKASSQFVFDMENVDYRLAFVVKEDSVGPYPQVSSVSQIEGLGAFTGAGSPVTVLFSDVARVIDNWLGNRNSIPSTVKAGETYEYTKKIDIKNVKNKKKFDVVALLLNGKTGNIENAGIYHFGSTTSIGDNLSDSASKVEITAGEGSIELRGEYTYAAVYTLDGRLVATAAGEPSVSVNPGLYIVKAGEVTAKVVVK